MALKKYRFYYVSGVTSTFISNSGKDLQDFEKHMRRGDVVIVDNSVINFAHIEFIEIEEEDKDVK